MDKIQRYLVNGFRSLKKINDNFFHDIDELGPGENYLLDSDLNKKKNIGNWYISL